jgi:hypothetical protein
MTMKKAAPVNAIPEPPGLGPGCLATLRPRTTKVRSHFRRKVSPAKENLFTNLGLQEIARGYPA